MDAWIVSYRDDISWYPQMSHFSIHAIVRRAAASSPAAMPPRASGVRGPAFRLSWALMSVRLLLTFAASAAANPGKNRVRSAVMDAAMGGVRAVTAFVIIASASASASVKSVSFDPAQAAVAGAAAEGTAEATPG